MPCLNIHGDKKKRLKHHWGNAACTFGPDSLTTTFVLEMELKADAQTIAGAIGEVIKPRYGGWNLLLKLG